MDKLRVDKCCCGLLPLREGTLVIGYIQLLFAFLALIVISVAAKTLVPEIDNNAVALGIVITISIILAIGMILSILLLIGTHKDRPGFILVWLIVSVVNTVIYIVLCILGAIHADGIKKSMSDLFGGLILSALSVYIIIVVYSHYNNVKGLKSQPSQ